MRIISGIYKNRNINSPEVNDTHPMGERERIALFNMIGTELKDATVLDAYAGSGALGIEAISRGAREVLFIDSSHAALRTTAENCMMLSIPEEKVAFYRGKVGAFYRKVIQGMGTATNPRMAAAIETFPREYDIVFADPPYDDLDYDDVCRLTKTIKDGGLLILSHPDDAPDFPGFTLEKTRQYARAHISIYRK